MLAYSGKGANDSELKGEEVSSFSKVKTIDLESGLLHFPGSAAHLMIL